MHLKIEKKCKTVAFDSKNFNSEVLTSLHTDRVIALTKLPVELQIAIRGLIDSGDNFFDHLHEYAKDEFPGTIEPKNVRGLFGPEKYPLLCNNGARFFVAMNKEGGINNEKMPNYENKPVMTDSARVFNRYTDVIIGRILEAIAHQLNIDTDRLKQAILGEAAIGLTRYYPITQNRAAQLFRDNVLIVNGDDVEQFSKHRDVNPITILVYRGEPRGLLVEDKASKSYVPLTVESAGEPYLLVFTGTTLKELTNGHIRALKHQVMTTPEEQHEEAKKHSNEWRFTLGKFTYFNLEELEPLKTQDGKQINPPMPRKHQRHYPLPHGKFFMDHLACETDIREKSKAKEFPEALAAKYPTDVTDKDIYVQQLGKDSIGAFRL
jgi:hypothetical protein